MKHGIKFERINDNLSKHSSDWGLVFSNKEITSPSVKTTTVDIPGGDGSIDLTEFLGRIPYNNGRLVLNFQISENAKDWDTTVSSISNFLHGQLMKITIWSDEGYYYLGRCSVDKLLSNKNLRTITITCDSQPYKYKQEITVYTYIITGQETIVLKNLRKIVVPKITVSDNVRLVFNDIDINLSKGIHKVLDIELLEGNNEVMILEGTGTISFEYQEGALY